MSTNVRIKQKSLFKKKLEMEDIVALTGLAYGVIDDNYRLIRNEMAENTLIYDENRLARGIDLWLDGTDILLSLSLPTTRSEIRLFYHVITTICNEVGTKKYIREEDTVSLKDNERFVQYDEEASIGALEDLQEKIGNDEYRRFEIFGVFNPISISLKEIQKIGNNLEQFEKYLHEIQALDVYYATSNVYRTPEEKLIGIYAIVADVPSVVPMEPYVIMNQIEGVEAWYVMLKKGEAIGYEDFINNLDIKDYYDANHVITVLSEAKIDELLKKYKVEL